MPRPALEHTTRTPHTALRLASSAHRHWSGRGARSWLHLRRLRVAILALGPGKTPHHGRVPNRQLPTNQASVHTQLHSATNAPTARRPGAGCKANTRRDAGYDWAP